MSVFYYSNSNLESSNKDEDGGLVEIGEPGGVTVGVDGRATALLLVRSSRSSTTTLSLCLPASHVLRGFGGLATHGDLPATGPIQRTIPELLFLLSLINCFSYQNFLRLSVCRLRLPECSVYIMLILLVNSGTPKTTFVHSKEAGRSGVWRPEVGCDGRRPEPHWRSEASGRRGSSSQRWDGRQYERSKMRKMVRLWRGRFSS